jgi:hypothetical protein
MRGITWNCMNDSKKGIFLFKVNIMYLLNLNQWQLIPAKIIIKIMRIKSQELFLLWFYNKLSYGTSNLIFTTVTLNISIAETTFKFIK